ncbi:MULTISPECIES: pyridoxal phosphate-dependent aminotransferase [unclassified Bradyrhizobium]|uniref:pyridoxal phosphate-dependent aminotransferase n=1 Tax=unclassified Bradyrhizobium TaxID=2631580 RepID=UPI001CD64BB3|nr:MULTISPECIES: pyridoxal phosphate-dependent aminotransferase [unclassified Bradyrhizobium]MCA1379040.1 pyridoxal phosphate-dependent aminotransferase [Bradyrhizobium sp. IC4060]MCA1489048.1 pyridoxal phosphate-dependent aminotransferase [Bradyrhizobium sp. IC4061]
MSLVSERLKVVRPSQTEVMTARAVELRDQGVDVITLSQGEPDFDTPSAIREAGIRAIRDGQTKYTAIAGIKPLREAIRESLRRDHGLDYGIDQITVGCGAKQVVFNALFASLDPGDEVVIPTPCWVSYPDMVALAGGKPVLVACDELHGFKLRPEALKKAITPRTKWLMLNSPCNPTGAVYSRSDLRALAAVLREHAKVHVLSDDIYEKLTYDADFATMPAVAPDLYERTLTVNGVSKADAMTGWRVGYGAGPLALIKAMNLIQGQTSSHTSSISQYAALEALSGRRDYIKEFVRAFLERRDLVVAKLNQAQGLSCGVPDGAFYVFPSCAGVIGKRTPDGKVIESDTDFAMYLLDAFAVAVVPGSGFMASPYIRISYASSLEELTRACDRIIAACATLS